MNFQLLQIRLIAHIKARVRNGEGTERGLARLAGISQPHMHNVLKGARVLSPELADQVLRRLRIDLLDLLEGNEGGDVPRRAPRDQPLHRTVALLDGYIGPEHPYPAAASGGGGYPFLPDDLEGLESVGGLPGFAPFLSTFSTLSAIDSLPAPLSLSLSLAPGPFSTGCGRACSLFFAVCMSDVEGTSRGTSRYVSTCSATRLKTGPPTSPP